MFVDDRVVVYGRQRHKSRNRLDCGIEYVVGATRKARQLWQVAPDLIHSVPRLGVRTTCLPLVVKTVIRVPY